MKTEAVQLIKGPHNLHYAKTPKSKVFLPIELGDGIYNKIAEIRQKDAHFDLVADYTNKPMIFYPKSADTTLMNFGPYTTVLKNDASTADIAEKMYAHTQKVLGTKHII